MMESDWLTD